MGYSDLIAREAETLSPENQAEILDFITFLKMRSPSNAATSTPQTPAEIEAFFRSFNVSNKAYQFDRDDANVR